MPVVNLYTDYCAVWPEGPHPVRLRTQKTLFCAVFAGKVPLRDTTNQALAALYNKRVIGLVR
jgi:hypothetical protein